MNVIWILLTAYTTITATQSNVIYFPPPPVPQPMKCVKNIELLPSNISTNFDIKIEKDHIELTVCNNDKFDYFKVPWSDYHCSCRKAIGLNVNLTSSRIDEENKICHGSSLIDDGFAYDSNHSKCSFEIFDDKSFSVIYITGFGYTNYVYAVHKETGEITEYTAEYIHPKTPHDESDDTDQFLAELNECLDAQNRIPKNLPISFDFTKRNSHIEIVAFRENHYDFYKINWEGHSCYQKIGEHRKPNDTMGVDNKLCDNRPLSTHQDYGTFRCAYDIWTTVHDDEEYFVFYVKSGVWRGANAYIINTSTNNVSFLYSLLKSAGEEIFEIYKTSTVSIKKCFEKKLQLPKHLPIEFEMLHKAGTTVILIAYANKTDYYEINRSGSVRMFKPRLDGPIRELDELSDWENADEALECPLVHLVDDRDYTILIVESPTQITAGYTYLINKETLDVSFKLYPNTIYSQCEIDVPQSKREVSNEFEHEIERCANQQNLLSSATNVSIARIDNHIRISVKYDGKYDLYVLNSKGYVCYAKRELTAPPINGLMDDALQECDKRRMTSCTGGVHTFKCGLEIVSPANGDFVALNILSRFCNTTTCMGSYTYLINKFTKEVHFKRYTKLAEMKWELDRTPAHEEYDSDFEECLNLRYAIPSDLPVKFNVSVVNHLNKHFDISVYDDGKYDYYELDRRGKAYYTDIRRDMNPIRSFEEHLRCDAQHPLGPCTYDFHPLFRCGYEVIKNETDISIFVYADDLNPYEYNVDRSSGKTLLYRYERGFLRSFEETFDNCLKKKYATDFHIPLEVTMKTKENSGETENYLAISVKYQGKYDLYVTEDWGYVRYVEMQLADEPNLTLADYSNNNRVNRSSFDDTPLAFRCPLKVVENENYVNVSVNALHYDHVYTIDKSNNAMTYVKRKDNFVLSLPIPDFELNYIAEVDRCMEKLSNFNGGPFPVTVIRNRNFLQILVEFNGTRHTYITNSLGEEMCRVYHEPQEEVIDVHLLLEDVYPDCISRYGPAVTFDCPTLVLTEDENQVTVKIVIRPETFYFTYNLDKLSGTMTYKSLLMVSFPAIHSVVLKSLIG
ncbi:uncharacterized protein LOC119078212 [Bradysia coprophila]|uniref:uncharacterized protein LOC119078212 n=1 Tax=Bradysia coprophila TaxID=38358 RepID=UPI00187DD179|nr:uncharacterized protein LOC119078212 [Bradysia coprophila]